MPASFTGPLAARLDKLCAITVVEVSRPTLLEPGCAYIGRGDADLLVSRRAAGLTALAAPAQANSSVASPAPTGWSAARWIMCPPRSWSAF